MLELYHNDMSTCAQKVRCQLGEKALEWTGHALNLRAGEQHRPEFLKLNSKGVVPVLVHDGIVVTESNIILEYIEEAFPEPPLFPSSLAARAEVRHWLQRLDTGLHLSIAVISIGTAFRLQLLAAHVTSEALEHFYTAMPDPSLRSIYQSVVPAGIEAPQFASALEAWMRCLVAMEGKLTTQNYLVGNALTLADFGMLPYACRFDHLRLSRIWRRLPNVASWYERMLKTEGYKTGIGKWINRQYLDLMGEVGESLRPRTTTLIDEIADRIVQGIAS